MKHEDFVWSVQAQAERLGVTPDTLAAEMYYASAEALAEALQDAADSPDEGEYLAPVYVAAHGRGPIRFGKVATVEGGTRHVFTVPQPEDCFAGLDPAHAQDA